VVAPLVFPIGLKKEMTVKSQDIDPMKDAMRAPWIAGNFAAIAKTIGAPDAEGFVARLALEPEHCLRHGQRDPSIGSSGGHGDRVGHDASSARGSPRAGS